MARKEKIRSIAIICASGYIATHRIQKLVTKEDVKLYLVTNRPANLPRNIDSSTAHLQNTLFNLPQMHELKFC